MAAKLSSNEIEAANRSEASALLIRCGYRVYRPEADTAGEDLVLRDPSGELVPVQLKSRLTVDWNRYGALTDLWILFPDRPFRPGVQREWYLVPHATLFAWIEQRHGKTRRWNNAWSTKTVSKLQSAFLKRYRIHPVAETG